MGKLLHWLRKDITYYLWFYIKNAYAVADYALFCLPLHTIMVSKETDIQIVNTLLDDRQAGFRMLFDAYYTPLCLYSVQMTDDFDASEDIVQSFFVHFWEKELVRNINGKLRAYLFSAIRNNTLQYLRDININTESIDVSIDLCDIDDDTNAMLEEREQKLLEALKLLSANEREALEHVVYEDRTYKQASIEMGISVNTLKTHLKRAMQKLRKIAPIIIFYI